MKLSRVINCFFYVIIFIVLSILLLSYSIPAWPIKIKLYIIASQSMQPVLNQGDLIFVKGEKNYNQGDIITFNKPAKSKNPGSITHRLIKSIKKGKTYYYQTKGDANNNIDSWRIPQNEVAGRFIFKIPLLGNFINLYRTPYGLVFFVLLPIALIIYSEIGSIKNELIKIFSQNDKNTK